jgi:hypothetical protein
MPQRAENFNDDVGVQALACFLERKLKLELQRIQKFLASTKIFPQNLFARA